MKFLGWLKGRGWLMVGLVSTALIGAPGCSDAGKKKVDQPDARNTLYGIWMDTVDEDEFAPVYGIWGDVEDDIRPPDLDGRMIDAMEQKDDPMDASVYGIWDVGAGEVAPEPEVMDMYGIFVDDVSVDGGEVDTKEPPNVDLYGVWLEDVKEP
jgi:hypothetical protein